MTHVNQLAPLVIGEVPPCQAGELFIQVSTKEAQILSHLAANHVLFAIPVKGKHQGLVAIRFWHHQEKTLKLFKLGLQNDEDKLNIRKERHIIEANKTVSHL